MTFNGRATPKCKPYSKRPAEALTVYGEPTRIMPEYGRGCMFMVDDMFCNAAPNVNKVYCETHAGICGYMYGREKNGTN